MIIDCHAHHINAPYNTNYLSWLKESQNQDYGPIYLWNNPLFEDTSKRLEVMRENQIDCSVITYSANIVQIIDSASPCEADRSEIVTDLNRKTRKTVQENQKRIVATSLVDLRLGTSALEEMERTSDWAVGYSVLAAYRLNGKIRFLDDTVFQDFWAKAAELKKPVFIHFSNLYKIDDKENPLPGYMNNSIFYAGLGQLMENTICLSRLIMSGLFDKYPSLKIVMGQLGGMYPFMLERFEMLYNIHLWGAKHKNLNVTNPLDTAHFMRNIKNYTDNVYADTHSMDINSIQCAIDILGKDKILFGSDLPITPEKWGVQHGIQQVLSSELSKAIKEKIFYENAVKLLNITL